MTLRLEIEVDCAQEGVENADTFLPSGVSHQFPQLLHSTPYTQHTRVEFYTLVSSDDGFREHEQASRGFLIV